MTTRDKGRETRMAKKKAPETDVIEAAAEVQESPKPDAVPLDVPTNVFVEETILVESFDVPVHTFEGVLQKYRNLIATLESRGCTVGISNDGTILNVFGNRPDFQINLDQTEKSLLSTLSQYFN